MRPIVIKHSTGEGDLAGCRAMDSIRAVQLRGELCCAEHAGGNKAKPVMDIVQEVVHARQSDVARQVQVIVASVVEAAPSAWLPLAFRLLTVMAPSE